MKKITTKNKLGYALGDLANGLTFGMSSTFLLAYYTDVLGITAMAAGTLFLIARIWDAINDPLMGTWADKQFKKSSSKGDKFRKYLLKGSWPVIVAGILMFWAPAGLSASSKLMWAYATYIVWGMAYTFINIPYGSLASVMTVDPAERASLSVSRGVGGMIGNLGVRVVVPIFLGMYAGDMGKGYLVAMIAMGIIGFASYVLAYFFTEENVEHESSTETVKATDALKVLKNNRPFIAVSIASIAMLTGMMINGAMSIYYFKDNLDALSLMAIAGLLGIIPMLILSPFLSKIVKKFGIQRTVSVSSLMAAAVYGLILVLPDNAYMFIGLSLFAGLFMTVPNMLVWAMVSDCIDYNQYLCGERQEGVIYGTYSFVRKMGQAAAGFLAGAGLAMIGYIPNAVEQTSSVLFGIKFLTVGLPMIGMFIAFIAYKYIWNLTEEKRDEVLETIMT